MGIFTLKIYFIFQDNRPVFRRRLTAFERLSLEQLDIIRRLVHAEFAQFIKVPGSKLEAKPDARYPTIAILHQKIRDCDDLPSEVRRWSLSTCRVVLNSMGFR